MSPRTRPMPTSARLLASTALAALLLAACGGEDASAPDAGGATDAGPAAGGGAVTVLADEFTFDPEDLTLASGATVRLENTGAIEHDFVVEGTDILIHADAGEVAEGTVDLEPGTYTFYCSIPGHRPSGMEGELTVE